MKDDDKEIKIYITPRNTGKSHFYKLFLESLKEPIWTGVDWAENSGMNRGYIISRNENVVEIRFKTATIEVV